MNADDKFQELWRSKKSAPAPSSAELIKGVSKVRNKLRFKLVFRLISVIAVMAYIFLVVIKKHPPGLITSYIGIVLVAIGIIIYAIGTAGFLKLLFQAADTAIQVRGYLEYMIRIRERQQHMHKTLLNIYFLCLSLGLGLIIIEPITRSSSYTFKVFVPIASALYLAMIWFFPRRKEIRRSEKEMAEMIAKLEAVVEDTKK